MHPVECEQCVTLHCVPAATAALSLSDYWDFDTRSQKEKKNTRREEEEPDEEDKQTDKQPSKQITKKNKQTKKNGQEEQEQKQEEERERKRKREKKKTHQQPKRKSDRENEIIPLLLNERRQIHLRVSIVVGAACITSDVAVGKMAGGC